MLCCSNHSFFFFQFKLLHAPRLYCAKRYVHLISVPSFSWHNFWNVTFTFSAIYFMRQAYTFRCVTFIFFRHNHLHASRSRCLIGLSLFLPHFLLRGLCRTWSCKLHQLFCSIDFHKSLQYVLYQASHWLITAAINYLTCYHYEWG